MGKSAIVTMVVGDRYRDLWRRLCAPNWRAYADRHGLDLCVIDDPLDASELAQRRGFSWQKLLIGTLDGFRHYDHLIWIDADIVVNAEEAPSILEGMPPDRIGAVRYHPLLSQPLLAAAHRRICNGLLPDAFCASSFRRCGLVGGSSQMIQGGVLVVPRDLVPVLERIYHKYPEPGSRQLQEQPYLSYELSAAGLTHFLDDKFNAVWYEYKHGLYLGDQRPDLNRWLVRKVLSDVYFLHFAGNQQDMPLLDNEDSALNSGQGDLNDRKPIHG
jgi:hypothetical protein